MRQVRTLMLRVWSGQTPLFEPVRPQGNGWVLGRDTVDGDSRMSRRHCEVKLAGGRWTFTDLGSANGSYVDARAIGGPMTCQSWRVLLVGRSLFVPLVVDARAPLRMRHTGDDILGPSLHTALEDARAIAERGHVIVFAGSEGCGYVPLARELHRILGEEGPFVVVDARAGGTRLPARGVVLVDGSPDLPYLLNLEVVRKALKNPALRVCLTSTRGPEESCGLPSSLVGRAGVVRVPSIDMRLEEIPWWVRHAVRSLSSEMAALDIDVTLPEACLLRPWYEGIPGLVSAVQDAASRPHEAARPRVMGRHLSEWAGIPGDELHRCIVEKKPVGLPPPRGRREPPSHLRQRELMAAVLVAHGDDREGAARALGITAEALEQWIRRHRLEAEVEVGVSESIEAIESFEVVSEDPEETV